MFICNITSKMSVVDVNYNSEGCKHYKRFCRFVTPCCTKIYTCRFCHDDKENHVLNRKEVLQLLCIKCYKLQPVQVECEACGIRFGTYTCLTCRLFDNKERKVFHCQECGLCRMGEQENYFHCKKCNMCYHLTLIDNHTCVENNSRTNCPICLEDLHTSRISLKVPPCGHLLHVTCFEELYKKGNNTCVICKTSYWA